MDTKHPDPYAPLYDADEEEEGEFLDRDPTLDECVRLWHEAVEWHKHSHVAERARWSPIEHQYYERLGLGELMPREGQGEAQGRGV